mmetsp:Transcript_8331/g.22232  ORF Transcript_8331/g.22232 Transcript_8331/m.22232 type:complete len:108 (-) Transcript_8331:1646-1969(-)
MKTKKEETESWSNEATHVLQKEYNSAAKIIAVPFHPAVDAQDVVLGASKLPLPHMMARSDLLACSMKYDLDQSATASRRSQDKHSPLAQHATWATWEPAACARPPLR